jgi:hypothetical protein
VTIGSPIPFINFFFNVSTQEINKHLEYRHGNILRWLNIINASDMISYPLTPLLKDKSSPYLVLEDCYCEDKENWLEQTVGQIEVLGLVTGSITAHTWYWRSSRVADLISRFILDIQAPDSLTAIGKLAQVTGMTKCSELMMPKTKASIFKNEILIQGVFRDDSGSMVLIRNLVGLTHAYVFNKAEKCIFASYVGWVHNNKLVKEFMRIKEQHCI